MNEPTKAIRPLPALTPDSSPFWLGGEVGELRVKQCETCGTTYHPSVPVCGPCGLGLTSWRVLPGTATVIGTTVNVQTWLPTFPPPYNVAVVALDDAPGVRLTTNVVNCPPEDVVVGMAVRVTFEEQGGVWFPLFEPNPHGAPGTGHVAEPEVRTRPPASARRLEDDVVLSGVGMSQVGRRLMRPALTLTIEACRAAVEDAGLTMDDIDGLSTYPGASVGGISEGGIYALESALRIQPTWHNGGGEIPGQAGSIVQAMLAVSSGLARHVLCFRTVWEATHTELMRTGKLPVPGGGGGGMPSEMANRFSFGAASPANWIALFASQYLSRYGATRETLGEIAVNARAGAVRNPEAIYRDPMTMDDYLSARMVSTPFGLFDCDVPCDGAVAVVVSAVETSDGLRQPGVRVAAVGTQITELPSWEQGTFTHLPGVFGAAAHLWSRTDLTVADVDVATIYDGFTFNCLSWLEALGVCGIGEASDYLAGGKRIGLGGSMPLNPHGGQLSAGRLHGYGFVREAMLQLRGEADGRQVEDAQVALVAVGGGVPGGCMLLTQG